MSSTSTAASPSTALSSEASAAAPASAVRDLERKLQALERRLDERGPAQRGNRVVREVLREEEPLELEELGRGVVEELDELEELLGAGGGALLCAVSAAFGGRALCCCLLLRCCRIHLLISLHRS